jgi:hypothetical protein
VEEVVEVLKQVDLLQMLLVEVLELLQLETPREQSILVEVVVHLEMYLMEVLVVLV